MKIIPKVGLDNLKFGLTSQEVKTILGNPSHEFTDEFGDLHLCYQGKGLAVKIEKENGNRAGWIMISDPSVSILDIQPIGEPIENIISHFQNHLSDTIESEDYGIWTSRTFENNWIEIQETLGFVTEINIGVPYDENDNAIWPE
jgi:hypothetical protein